MVTGQRSGSTLVVLTEVSLKIFKLAGDHVSTGNRIKIPQHPAPPPHGEHPFLSCDAATPVVITDCLSLSIWVVQLHVCKDRIKEKMANTGI